MIVNKHLRDSLTSSLELLGRLCPAEPAKTAWATFAANSIRVAAAVSPQTWELSTFPDLVRLNVGQIAVLDLRKNRTTVYIQGALGVVPQREFVLDEGWADYKAVPGPNQRWLIDTGSLPDAPAELIERHHRLIEEAASRKPKSPFLRAHSPGMVAAIHEYSPVRLPARENEHKASGGAGFGGAEQNRQIEQEAIRKVLAHYESCGWSVRSVERENCGYDLHCVRRNQELHVEVKGAGSRSGQFLLTAREFHVAFSDDRFVLAFVDGIASDSPQLRTWSARAFRSSFRFEAIQYSAKLA